MSLNRRTFIWSVVGLTLLGLILRLPRLGWQPLWWDEGYSAYFATEPLGRMAWLTARDIHPPLYYALLHLWTTLLGGTDPVTLRAFSVAWGVLTIPLIVWLARELFPQQPRSWFVAGLLLALSPMHIFYSQEIRMYGMAMALLLAATALFWRWLRQPSWGRAAWYVVVALLALYTLYYSALVLLAHFAWGFWHARRNRQQLVGLFGMGVAIAVGYLPWIIYAAPKLAPYVSNKVATDADTPLGLPQYLWRHSQTFLAGHIAPEGQSMLATLLGAIGLAGWLGLLLLGIGLATRNKTGVTTGDLPSSRLTLHNAYSALATFALVPLTLAFLLNLRLPFFPEGGERLLLTVLPFVLILIGAAIDLTWPSPRLGAYALAAFLLGSLAGLVTFYTTPRYADRDYRPLIGQIVQQGGPDDTVFAVFPWQIGYWRAYVPTAFRNQHGPQARLAAEGILEWGPEIQAAVDAALAQGTVWFPEPLSFGSTLPGEIEAYLAPRSANLVNRWYGPATRLTAWRALPQGELTAVDADFGPALLSAARIMPSQAASANEPVAVTLAWQVAPGNQAEDYYVTLRLVDEEGRQWAARDYAPLGGLAVEREPELVEQVGLTVPAGLPPGAYTLAVGLGERASQSLLRPTTVGPDVEPFHPLAALEVTQSDALLPVARLPIQFPLDRPVIDNGLTLLGHAGATDEEPTLAGTELSVRLFVQNQAAEPPPRRLYVSLRDKQGNAVAEWEGWTLLDYPTESWPEGALVQMPVTFLVPPTVQTGDYTLITRLVDPNDGADGPTAELGTVQFVNAWAHSTSRQWRRRWPNPCALAPMPI